MDLASIHPVVLIGCSLYCAHPCHRALAAVVRDKSDNFTLPAPGNWSESANDSGYDDGNHSQAMSNYRSAFVLIVSLSALCILAMGFLAYGLFSRAEAIKDDEDAAAEMDMDQSMFGGLHDGVGGGGGFGD